jgi:hypothetical protein
MAKEYKEFHIFNYYQNNSESDLKEHVLKKNNYCIKLIVLKLG